MIIVIIGPTGIGKTALSLALANHLKTEIISGDSVQVYRGLDIGSAKIKPEDMEGIPHHMIDIFNPKDNFTVAVYQRMVRSKIEDLLSRNKTPIIVGGTGFYIKSVLHQFNFAGRRPKSFDQYYQDLDNQALHNVLLKQDAIAAERIHHNNRVRVLQALYRAQVGTPVSEETAGEIKKYEYLILALTCDRTLLYERINQRVDKMFDDGLLSEVQTLYKQGIKSHSVSAIGYKELYRYFDEEISLEDAKELIKKNTRNYAKKQYTYFKNQFDVQWITVDFENPERTMDKALNIINNI